MFLEVATVYVCRNIFSDFVKYNNCTFQEIQFPLRISICQMYIYSIAEGLLKEDEKIRTT